MRTFQWEFRTDHTNSRRKVPFVEPIRSIPVYLKVCPGFHSTFWPRSNSNQHPHPRSDRERYRTTAGRIDVLKESQRGRILPTPRIQNNLETFEGPQTELYPYWQVGFHTSAGCGTPLIKPSNFRYLCPTLGITDTSLEERISRVESQPGDIVGDSARELIQDMPALNFDIADIFIQPYSFLVKTEFSSSLPLDFTIDGLPITFPPEFASKD